MSINQPINKYTKFTYPTMASISLKISHLNMVKWLPVWQKRSLPESSSLIVLTTTGFQLAVVSIVTSSKSVSDRLCSIPQMY